MTRVVWLGQAGLLFDFDGFRVMVDPYLSDSVAALDPAKHRRVPVDERFFEVKPDVLVLTHDHLDHTDPDTLGELFRRHGGVCVLASPNAWNTVRRFGGGNNYVRFARGAVWTEGSVRFEALYAEHSDENAIGVLITAGGKRWYVTGDTLYSKRTLAELTGSPDVLFLPVNGVGNNMNMTDAARFAEAVGARRTVPLHFGLFDGIDPRALSVPGTVIPEIYQEIRL